MDISSGNASSAYDVAMSVGVREQVDVIRNEINNTADMDPDIRADANSQLNVMTAALVAKDVYFTSLAGDGIPQLLPDGVQRLTTSEQLSPIGLTPTTLDPEDGSDFHAAAYYDANQERYLVADKGTSIGVDWLANAGQALGLGVTQYADAAALASQVAASPDARDVTFVGHSLGGGLASLESLKTQDLAITFNSAGLNPLTLGGTSDSNASNLIQAYYVGGEILSTVQDYSVLASAEGTRIELPAYNEMQMGPTGVQPSSTVGFFQGLSPLESVNLHFMSSVISSLYSALPVFGQRNQNVIHC
jgi:hypothetical protein